MVDYLKGVKMYSLVIMATHISTSTRNWKLEWIEYVDGYGSNTVVKNGTLILDEGCPFVFGKLSLFQKQVIKNELLFNEVVFKKHNL